VRNTCAEFDVRFELWQDGAGRLILAKRSDGLYAADQVVISIPRQVGKTFLIGWIVFALCIIIPELTVLWTAHRFKTANETYNKMAAMARRKKVASHVKRVTRAATDQGIEFRNGSRIMFGARERGFGRGFDAVGVVVCDEAQILTSNAIDDMIPATNQAENPLIIYLGTPPKPDDAGEVFTDFRERAITGKSTDTLYIELSADRNADPMDRNQWRKANPSYPHHTTERAMLRMVKNLSIGSFPREGLGIWDESTHKPIVTEPAWEDMHARGVLPDVPVDALGIDANGKGEWFAAGCWMDDDSPHIELLPLPADLTVCADLVAARCGRRVPVAIHASSPANGTCCAPRTTTASARSGRSGRSSRRSTTGSGSCWAGRRRPSTSSRAAATSTGSCGPTATSTRSGFGAGVWEATTSRPRSRRGMISSLIHGTSFLVNTRGDGDGSRRR
jgi:hypothetical protein